MYSIDFETYPIVPGSAIPPKPVGLSIKYPDKSCRYYAFGHPTGNNCTEADAKRALEEIWDREFITHNGLGFDMGVAEYWWGLPPRSPLLTHDTLFQAYLLDPHAKSLKLKDLCRDWLGMGTDAQEALVDWIMANVPECRSRKRAGEFIYLAPGDIVGRYANDDVDMAFNLHEYCYPKILDMEEPYNRERLLAPILADIKRRGIRVDVPRLKADYKLALNKLHELTRMIQEHLNCPDLNPGSDAELANALEAKGYKGFLLTPTGRRSVSKDSLEKVLAGDPKLQSMLRSRAAYDTLTGTFMGPWLEYAEMNGGTINPAYNQVRNPEGYGTRTGRLSSSEPNGQNIPKDQGIDYFGDPFPLMRGYCLPDPGCVWMSIDFKAQEPRLTAHFEDGALLESYIANPDQDVYMFVKEAAGGDTTRFEAKQIFLGLVYAMGVQALAEKINADYSRANSLKNQIKGALPDVVELDKDCRRRFKNGLPIRTLGGRLCYCEPPSNGRSWEYKALNLLIQGSAADQTKEAMIYTDDAIYDMENTRQLGNIHDEINLSVPPQHVEVMKRIMLEAANALPCDCPMRITIGVGHTWAEASKE